MIRQIKRYLAVRSYARHLPKELARRWGAQRFYSLDQVSQAARNLGLDETFITCAHAMYCVREDFDACYGPLHVRCTYDGLRAEIAKWHFKGAVYFDARDVIPRKRSGDDGTFYESGIGSG